MPRVLHLCDAENDFQTRTLIGLLTRGDLGPVRSLGKRGDFATTLIGLFRLRAIAADYDLIHAWGAKALTLAALGSNRKIVYSPTTYPNRHDLRWLRSTLAARDLQIVCSTNTIRRRLVRHGVPIERTHLILPGVDSSRLLKKRDPELRKLFGFREDDYLILANGESMLGANHHSTILTLCVLNVYERRHKLALWGRGSLGRKEVEYCDLMWPVSFVAVGTRSLGDDVEYYQMLSAADAVIVTADAPVPTLPIATAMAMGLPIVSTLTPTISELLEDRRNALLTAENRSRILAKRFLDLKDDPQLSWKISDQARADAYELFAASRFVNECEQLYESVYLNRPAAMTLQLSGA